MLVYFIIAFFLFITAKSRSKFVFLSVCFLLFFITAFRGYSVGTDTMNYQMLFLGGASEDKVGELAFNLLYMGLNAAGLDFRFFLIVTAALFWGQLFFQSYLNMKNTPVFSIVFVFLLGYCFMFFNISRQMIAVAIGMWAFYLEEKKANNWQIVLVILLSSIFHTSGLVLLFIFLIRRLKVSYGVVAIILLVTFISPFLLPTNLLIDSIISKIGLLERFSQYLSASNKEGFSFNRLFMNILFIIMAIRQCASTKDVYFKGIIFGMMILNLFPTSSFITRSGIYFLMCQIVFFPRYYKRGDMLDRSLVWVYSFSVFLSFVLNNNGGFVPYTLG